MEEEEYMDDLISSGRPGQFGNVIKRAVDYPRWNDPRLTKISKAQLADKKILFVGGGDGSLPIQIALEFKPESIEAIDVDPKMIRAAVKNLDLVQKGIEMKKSKLRKMVGLGYFKDDPFAYGLTRTEELEEPLHRVLSFQINNIIDLTEDFLFKKFDVVFCLRLTKFLHLNFGDGAVKALMHNLSQLVSPGGLLFFEAQSYHSYLKSKNRCPAFKKNFEEMKISPSELVLHLTKMCHFIQISSFEYTASIKKKPRTVYILRKC